MAQIFSSERPAQRQSANMTAPAQAGPDAPGLSALQRKADASAVTQKLSQLQQDSVQRIEEDEMLQGKSKNPNGLPAAMQAGMERASSTDLSDVSVHYNSAKPATLQAHAFAQGTDIHLAPGQEQHLGHEAWHTVQQKKGRVKPTTEVAGTPVNDSPSLEREADVMGAKFS